MPKASIVVPVTEVIGKPQTVNGLTYHTAGDGIGFHIRCQCGRDNTMTEATINRIKEDLTEELKKTQPKMELEPVLFSKLLPGDLCVATTDDNGHGYPRNWPLLKISDQQDGGYCLSFPGFDAGGTKHNYFYSNGRMQTGVHRIKAVNKEFVKYFGAKPLKKFFVDLPIKKL